MLELFPCIYVVFCFSLECVVYVWFLSEVCMPISCFATCFAISESYYIHVYFIYYSSFLCLWMWCQGLWLARPLLVLGYLEALHLYVFLPNRLQYFLFLTGTFIWSAWISNSTSLFYIIKREFIGYEKHINWLWR
mgnify:FL=1